MTTKTRPGEFRFHITPTWLGMALLAAEVFLCLSDRYRWFAFNEYKGWTAIIAAGLAGAVALFTLVWFAASLLFRLGFQFRIRSLLVFVPAVAIPLGLFSQEMWHARQQRQAVEAIETAGNVFYDWQELSSPTKGRPPAPAWLMRLLGDDFFGRATKAFLDGSKGTRAELEQLSTLPDLNAVVVEGPEVSDAVLECLNGLPQVPALSISITTTDEGIERIGRLRQLITLELSDGQITEAGLKHLEQLDRLQVLVLRGSLFTDAALEHVKGLPQLEVLDLRGSEVTDAGLDRLIGLIKLERLYLSGTHVTDEGIAKLQGALPNCTIAR